MTISRLLRMDEIAERTGVPVGTLRYWRKNGDGPPAARVGRRVAYREADVAAWIDAHFEASE
ncbi:helix-turn-helix domain-containing protein [Nocardioides sp. QY071]|uniref:helix-turn-helix transcriptional regulator n=1 Tax=Nocardioides sp. QY071 TaxID=3044187 RepID=UPI00249B00A0|nr:helix-turn-helix domain-containing protein [Nocardioides sp. QY071]WGY03735.1 helix-turn-helix domain-containing protein [Nocardioides sp. QY071]